MTARPPRYYRDEGVRGVIVQVVVGLIALALITGAAFVVGSCVTVAAVWGD